MKRREFVGVLVVAAAAWPFAVRAQAKRVAKIAALLGIVESDPETRPRVEAFLTKLREIGWTQGRDYNLDVRFGGSDASLMSAQAKELVGSKPDVILSQSNLALASLLSGPQFMWTESSWARSPVIFQWSSRTSLSW